MKKRGILREGGAAVKKRGILHPIVEDAIRMKKVEVRDHALSALRRADAFMVIAVVEGEARTFRFAETVNQLDAIADGIRRFRRELRP